MKQIFIGLIAIFAITFAANAQTKTGVAPNSKHHEHSKHNKRHHKHHKGMALKNLNLSEAQKQQVQSMNADFKNKMGDLKKNDNMAMKDFNSQKDGLMKERKAKMQSILTPEQKTKMEQSKKDMIAKRGEMQQKRMEKMKTKLGLSTDQVSKMNSQRDAFKLKAASIKNNEALTKEQKKDQFMSLRKEQKENFKSILTQDQQKKLEERKGKRSMKTT